MRLLFVFVLLTGCTVCDDHTLLVDISLPDDHINDGPFQVWLSGAFQGTSVIIPHQPGQRHVTTTLPFSSQWIGMPYRVDVQIDAQVGLINGQFLGGTGTFVAGCNQIQLRPEANSSLVVVNESAKSVDLMFVIDDSPAMAAQQSAFLSSLAGWVKRLEANVGTSRAADYHIGVITTDLGAGPTVVGACRPGGRGARFQAVGKAAPSSCFGPTGHAFLQYNQLMQDSDGKPVSNASDLLATLTCMASVGHEGCPYPMPLESAYQAIQSGTSLAENQGFFRPNALLEIVFVTDQEDCSADANSNLFSRAEDADVGPPNIYRCTRAGVVYSNPAQPMPFADSGPISDARPAGRDPLGLFSIDRYINFFDKTSARGGAKLDPTQVAMVSLAGPTSPVSSVLGVPDSWPITPCSPLSSSCVARMAPSCVSPNNPVRHAEPAIRLDALVKSVRDQLQLSVCDDDQSSALDGLFKRLDAQTQSSCISAPLVDASQPDCTFFDEQAVDTGETVVTPVPACTSGGALPCWRLVQNAGCPSLCSNGASQQLAVHFDRDPNLPRPQGSYGYCLTHPADVSCVP